MSMNIPAADREKLEKLKALRDDPAATAAESKAAQDAMDRIMRKHGYKRRENPLPKTERKSAPPPNPFPKKSAKSWVEKMQEAADALQNLASTLNRAAEAVERSRRGY